ncbi:MAG: thioredoxin family protein [Clostridiales bacterium]|jgi:thioredoxin 1|nr:thioredoxin family protein [Clostridiales bacterium]
MIEVNDLSGPDTLKKGKYILMFYTDWCPRCPPIISALSSIEEKRRGQFIFAKIDFDKNPQARDFFDISGVPAILSIRDGLVLTVCTGIGDVSVCEEAVSMLCDERS